MKKDTNFVVRVFSRRSMGVSSLEDDDVSLGLGAAGGGVIIWGVCIIAGVD